MVHPRTKSLPEHDEVGPLTRALEVVCLASAVGLLLFHLFRFLVAPWFFVWWVPLAALAGMLFADFACGVIHWTADTWGSESLPVVGRRFLRPFRLHHINPNDFLRRNFVDTNGDVALMTIPIFLSAFLIPLDHNLGRIATVFLVASASCALPTNQVHQWAHMSQLPSWVHRLQRRGLLLSPAQHQIHHAAPYARNYCITTGWCNPALTALNFFPAAEWVIFRLTGLEPRGEDRGYGARFEVCALAGPEATSGKNP
jgi:ubiquitin-conjugating enzyme E2 variant